MRALLPFLGPILMVAALLLAVMSVLGASFTARGAQLVQRVEVSADTGASLFGGAETGTPIGSPQLLIVRDEQAFLPGSGAGGVRLISEGYLREHQIYPLQAKTVWFIRDMLLLGALALLVLGIALHWWVRRRA